MVQLSDGTASTAFFGWVVAAFSMGQLVASPLFGLWFDHRPPQEPVIVSLIIGLVANVVYSYAEAFPGDSPRYVLIAARVVVGISAGDVHLSSSELLDTCMRSFVFEGLSFNGTIVK